MMAKTISPSAKSARSSKTSKKAADKALVLNHTETTVESDDSGLASLIASLDAPASDEVVETVTEAAAIDADTLEHALASVEARETSLASATPEGVVEASAVPTGDASDVVVGATEKKAKKAATPRKHYTDKTERLKDKLGDGLTEYSVLTLSDAEVSEAELSAVMEKTMTIIREMNKKEQNWAVKFIEFLAGKKAKMSEVTQRILTVLQRDGMITTGNEGNVFKDLVSKPYSIAAARAMGGNNIGMLADLKVIVKDSKGKYLANPDSLLLAKAMSMLAAAPAAEAAPSA